MVAEKTSGVNMSASLEKITSQRLEQFRRRWQTLESAQGIAVALLLALSALLLVVMIDAALVVPQAVRWLLSLVIYGALAACLLVTYLRVKRNKNDRATARRFEDLEPQLKERLLSAIDLSEDTPSNRMSSLAFRERAQQKVAQLIENVRIGKLLPWSSIARGLVAATVGIGIAVALSWVPGLHWSHRVARALLPGANLGRISRFEIEILSPQPASTTLPAGSVAAVEARVRGPLPDNVLLETRVAGELDSQTMRGITRTPTASSSGQATAVELTSDDLVYMANVTVGEATIEYRVLAEDAHTPWYQLSTRPRPEVESFTMRIAGPPYSQLPDQTLTSSEGDMSALRGSRVTLGLTCNQPISQGWLEVMLPEATAPKKVELKPVPVTESAADPAELIKLEGRRFSADLVIDSDFTYRVHLEAADTKFTNAFSAEYQVRALVDDPPRLAWLKPEGNMLVVEPNQLIPLAIQITDELPLAEAELITSLNGETPITVKLEIPAPDKPEAGDTEANSSDRDSFKAMKFTIASQLDLLQTKPKIGDTLRLAIQATDRAGQSSVSTPIELIISSTAVDPQRRPATEERLAMAAELRKFAEQVTPQVKRMRELHEEFAKLPPESEERIGKLSDMKKAGEELSRQASEVAKQAREKALEYLKQPQDSVSLAELERVGLVLSRIENELSQELAKVSQLVDISSNSESEPDRQKVANAQKVQISQVRNASEKLNESVGVLDRRFREFVAHDILSEVARGLSVVQDFQEQLALSSEEETPAQLKRRQAVVSRQLRELEQIMVDRSPLLREQASHGLRGWIEWAGGLAERIERAAADNDDNPNFKEFTKQVLNEVNQHQNILGIDGGLESEINNGRRELDSRSDSANSVLRQLAKSVNESVLKNSGKVSPELRQEFQLALNQLQQRKDLEQARGDADAYHVSDLGNAVRATRQLIEPSADKALSKEQVEQLNKTTAAVKKLEAIHNVTEANKHLADLEQVERWNSDSVEARTESPRAWDALRHRLEQSARALREAGIDPKLAEQVDRIRYDASAKEAAQKIQSRRWSNDAQVSAESELAEMRDQMDTAREQLDVVARAARQELMEMAPSVPELARQAARETADLQQRTEKLSKDAAADEVADLKTRMDELSSEQQKATTPINDLRDALTEMAAMQDLLDDNQRAIARDADTSGQIIDKASEQISESLKPAAEAASPTAAAKPLEAAAAKQADAKAALEQIADHFEKLQAGDIPANELADSRQGLKKLASELDAAAMDEWYKTAEDLSKLASGDPQQVLEKLEAELNRNARMREELSDIAKKALDESVQSLSFSADQERKLQSEIELSDPQYASRKQILQHDIQAANERMHQWMQQLSSDASTVAGRANARPQQQRLTELQQQLQQAMADASAAHVSLPLEDLQRVADAVVKSLEAAKAEFNQVSGELKPSSDAEVHASEQELKNRKREMEDWERRMLQQQARGAQSVERSHEQRVRQANNATRNAESLKRTAERARDDVAKQAKDKPDDKGMQQRLLDAERQLVRVSREAQVTADREEALKERLAVAKQTQQEMTARKNNDLNGKNPTAELATRLAAGAAQTSQAIADELKKALDDAGWTTELTASAQQLQWGQRQQDRVEQNVGEVAGNLDRAARHEQRLDHPQAADRISQQALQVKHTKEQEVHDANEQLTSAAQQAKLRAEENSQSAEIKDTATPVASLAARGAVSAAESELRSRVRDLKNLLQQPQPEEDAAASKDPSMAAPAEPSVPLDPKMLARMLDELDRQMSDAASQQQQGQEPNESQQANANEASQSQDENNKQSSQQSSPSGHKKGSKTSSMQEASRQLAEQMNKQRAQGRQSTASSRMTGNTADTKAAPPSAVRVLSVDRRSGEDWGKLREQAADQTLESARQSIAPQYRSSVETYFRVLGERGALDK